MCTSDSSCRSFRKVIRGVLSILPALALCLLMGSLGPRAWAQIDGGACDPNALDSGCPSDGNPCTNEVCDAGTHTCKSVPRICAIDNLCNTATCNPSNGLCEYTPKTCGNVDGDLCTTDVCNPSTGQCEAGAPKSCATDNLCSTGSCNSSSGQCEYTPKTCGNVDGDLCTSDTCNPSTGQCEPGAPKNCATDSPCTTGSCNPSTGQCEVQPVTCAQDGDLCTVESCNPSTGQCESGASKNCNDDDLCSTDSCNPSTGQCGHTPVTCPSDSDNCTDEVCDSATGACHSVPANPAPDNCGATICRTPGFWGTHAGVEKSGSQNITQAVITAGGGSLAICGETITDTVLSDDESAVEAICVAPKDSILYQLARQLTAAALNCVVSNGVPDCSQTPVYTAIFASCNAACANPASTKATITDCISQIDCLNNGGKKLGSGMCQTGTCANGAACTEGKACADGSSCKGLDNNCHDQLLINSGLGFNFEPPGPAGSSNECNDATKNACKVIGASQTKCTF